MAQPTTWRECKSSTAARNSQPLRARIWVISHARARSVRNCWGLGAPGCWARRPGRAGCRWCKRICAFKPAAVHWPASGSVSGAVPCSRPAVAGQHTTDGCRRPGRRRQKRAPLERWPRTPQTPDEYACARRGSLTGLPGVPGTPGSRIRPFFAVPRPTSSTPEFAGEEGRGFF